MTNIGKFEKNNCLKKLFLSFQKKKTNVNYSVYHQIVTIIFLKNRNYLQNFRA